MDVCKPMYRYQIARVATAAAALAEACGWDLPLAHRVLEGLRAVAEIPLVEEGRCPQCKPLQELAREYLEAEQRSQEYAGSDPATRAKLRARVDCLRAELARAVAS